MNLSDCTTDSDCPDNLVCGIGYGQPSCVACGGLITTTFGYISSRNFPNDYPNNLDCEWHIIVPVDERIKIDFISFNTEYATDCE